jgi:NitT/TauT family transport system permease protein
MLGGVRSGPEGGWAARGGVRFLLGFLPFAAVGAAWVLLVHWAGVPPVLLPPLEEMPHVVWRMFAEGGVAGDVLVSCLRVGGGFLLAVALATPLGVFMGCSPRVRQAFEPVVGFLRYLPVPVFIPLCLLWFGTGEAMKVAVIFLGSFFQLTLMVRDAAARVRPEYYEAATMLGAPRHDLVLRVLWPAALPQIFDAYRVGVGWAWTYVVAAEMIGATSGIGYYIIKSQRYVLVPEVFAATLLIGVLGMATDVALAAAHRRLFPWEDMASASEAH